MDNTHTHTGMRTESSCCAKLQCVYPCIRLRFITVHTQTVAVFLCQCLMRGWESGDLTAVRSSCSLELPPVPIHSLKASIAHTHTHTLKQTHGGMQTRGEAAHTKTCLHKHTHTRQTTYTDLVILWHHCQCWIHVNRLLWLAEPGCLTEATKTMGISIDTFHIPRQLG